ERDGGVDLLLGAVALAAQARGPGCRVEGDEPLLELDAHPARLLCLGDEEAVQLATRHGVDELAIVASVAVEMRPAVGMDHAPEHGDGPLEDLLVEAHLVERVEAARGHCQVDRAAGSGARAAQIGTALVDHHLVPAAREEERKERTHRARSEDRRRLRHRSSSRMSEASAWTSSKRV